MIVQLFEKLDKNRLAVRVCTFISAGVVLLYTLLFADNDHPHTWLEAHIPAFWTLFTIAACGILVIGAKIYGSLGIKREEDYYDK